MEKGSSPVLSMAAVPRSDPAALPRRKNVAFRETPAAAKDLDVSLNVSRNCV